VGDLQTSRDQARQPQAAGFADGDLQTGRDRARQATTAGWGGSLLRGVGISFKPWPWGGLWAVVRCPAGTHLRKEKKKKKNYVDFGKKISLHRMFFDIYNYFF
jgi:hypothetical protein